MTATSSSVGTGGAALVFNPYDYAVHEDPYPLYRRLRAEAPLYRNEELDFWALSRHADVLGAFRDLERFSNSYGVSLDPAAYGPHAHRSASFLAMDPPEHTRLRTLVGRGFTPRRVAALEERIRAITLLHLLPALERRTLDFVADLAGKVPMDVISELIGVPTADRTEIRRLADLVVHREDGVPDVPAAGLEAALTLAGYYGDLVAEKRSRPGDDLTSVLTESEPGGERLSDDEIVSVLFLMVVAGNETTTKLLANAWYWGWRHPGELQAVWATPSAWVPRWVEETLRFDTSSQIILRRTREPVELHGEVVPAGERVLLLIGSANRDPEVFPDPDRYALSRDTSQLVSFGSGRHFCLGAHLARLESRVVLEELAARLAGYEIDLSGAERVHSVNVRGWAQLPTSVTPR